MQRYILNSFFYSTNEYFSTFAPHWFTDFFIKNVIKRESGVNPEQSRCCKFQHCMLQTKTHTTEHRFGKESANRNKSEDLPCFYPLWFARMNPTL